MEIYRIFDKRAEYHVFFPDGEKQVFSFRVRSLRPKRSEVFPSAEKKETSGIQVTHTNLCTLFSYHDWVLKPVPEVILTLCNSLFPSTE